MNNQELFDKMVGSILTQGKPSQASGECRYRGPNGLKCAAGWLIPDELYDKNLEGMAVYTQADGGQPTDVESILRSQGILPNQLSLVQRCQEDHDTASSIADVDFLESYRSKSRKTAQKYNLTWNFN